MTFNTPRGLRILYYLPVGTIGHPTHTRELVCALLARGHDICTVRGSSRGLTLGSRSPKAMPTRIGAFTKSMRALSRMRLSVYVRPFEALAREVLTIGYCLAAMLTGRLQPVSLVYSRHHLWSGDHVVARLLKVPLVKEVNGIVTADLLRRLGGKSPWFEQFVQRIEDHSLPRADRFIVVAQVQAERLMRVHYVPASKITVVTNGANTDLFVSRDKVVSRHHLGLPIERKYVLFAGYMGAHHRQLSDLIACSPVVLANHPNAVFLMVGDGTERPRLEMEASAAGVADAFKFIGAVPYEVVPWYCGAADVCTVCLSSDDERVNGFSPLKVYEYLASGRPVVASRLETLQFIEREGAGVLVDTDDPSSFGRAICELLDDSQRGAVMGERGREYVVAHASWAMVAHRTEDVLWDALGGRTEAVGTSDT